MIYLCQGCGCLVHGEYLWTHAARDERSGVSADFVAYPSGVCKSDSAG